jgi:SPOR domain
VRSANILTARTVHGKAFMAKPINTPLAGEIWHLSIEDLFAPVQETQRLGGDGPFVINLSVSTAPISQPSKSFISAQSAHVYQIQVTEDGRMRYRLRIGPFADEDEADAILAQVRDIYPGALTATAGAADLRAVATLQAKRDALQSPAKKSPDKVAVEIAIDLPPVVVPVAPIVKAALADPPKPADHANRAAPTAIPPESRETANVLPVAALPLELSPAWALSTYEPSPVVNSAPVLTEMAAPKPRAPLPTISSAVPTQSTLSAATLRTPVLTDVVLPAPKLPVPDVAAPLPAQAAAPTIQAAPASSAASIRTPVLTEVVARTPKLLLADVAAAPLAAEAAAPTMKVTQASRALTRRAPILTQRVAPTSRMPAPDFLAAPAPAPSPTPTPKTPPPPDIVAARAPAPTPKTPPPPDIVEALREAAASMPKASSAPPVTIDPMPVLRRLPTRAPRFRAPSVKASAPRLTSTQVVASVTVPVPRQVKQLSKPLIDLESTQTVRALTAPELEDDEGLRWFVIQLSQAEQAFDPDAVPNLDIFSEYRLYSVAGNDQGHVMHALRLGFFTEEIAAVAVASYLGAYYENPTIRRVSVAERERFVDQRVEARKDVGATGRHAVIEITNELVARYRRTPTSAAIPESSNQTAGERRPSSR